MSRDELVDRIHELTDENLAQGRRISEQSLEIHELTAHVEKLEEERDARTILLILALLFDAAFHIILL